MNPSRPPLDADALVRRMREGITGPYPPPEAVVDPAVPAGELLRGILIIDTPFYPGTENEIRVHIPAAYDPAKPACLMVKLDGLDEFESVVFDNLIAAGEVPVIITVGILPGANFRDSFGTPDRRVTRFNRSFQFDSMNDRFARFVCEHVLPRVEQLTTQDGRAIRLSRDPNDRATMGASTAGIGAFTLAWQRPDQFRRVFSSIGTFVAMRGGHEYPALIRKTEPKPIRLFLEDGMADECIPEFGSWWEANRLMEPSLRFAGYDMAHAFGPHGHDATPGRVIFPDIMRWMWRDWPAPVVAGTTQNPTLQKILRSGHDWQKIPSPSTLPVSLAADPDGRVWTSDPVAGVFGLGGTAEPHHVGERLTTLAFGPDGTLYGSAPDRPYIFAWTKSGQRRVVASPIAAIGLLVAHDGTLFASEPGAHPDQPSTIWRVAPGNTPIKIDEGLQAASGLAFSPDGALFFAAENSTRWIYSYLAAPDGTLSGKQPYFWLHVSDVETDSGAQGLAVDALGHLYVATRLGIQVCDQVGRVRAILPLPTPCGPARSLCFGGANFDELHVTDGRQIWKRRMNVTGHAPWAKPADYPSQGGG